MAFLTLDTCFLIDYQRESKSRRSGPVARFLREHERYRLKLSTVAWGEFLAVFEDEAHPFVRFAADKLDMLPVTIAAAEAYRSVYRSLEASGRLIGANDLWIACVAIANEVPLVTRNTGEFQRIEGLDLLTY